MQDLLAPIVDDTDTALGWVSAMELNVEQPNLSKDDAAFLKKLRGDLPILADLSRSDILLYYYRPDEERAIVIGQAQPHSVSPIYHSSLLGRSVTRQEEPAIFRVLHRGGPARGYADVTMRGAPTIQQVYPVYNRQRHILGAMSIETNVVEYERHNRRSPVFRKALTQLQQMVLRGELEGAATLSPFAEHDGIIFVDPAGNIRYVSGVAENLHRKLGFGTKLLKSNIKSLPGHEAIFQRALETRACIEQETQEGSLIWIRKAIPVTVRGYRWPWQPEPAQARLVGVFITIHDATDARRKEQELRIKQAMIQEIHHRVKNNLQTIAALLRIQARRLKDPEAQAALQESVSRILSVAVVHEFLSHDESTVINMREVGQRILAQTREGILDKSKGINLVLRGDSFSLPAQRATACALVINELVQNAVEHGYADRQGGTISLDLKTEGNDMIIEVADDGEGLPPNFDLSRSSSLGLKIVQTLVKEDLKGTFQLLDGRGVRAVVRFPKNV